MWRVIAKIKVINSVHCVVKRFSRKTHDVMYYVISGSISLSGLLQFGVDRWRESLAEVLHDEEG